jgi:hypothetical protein
MNINDIRFTVTFCNFYAGLSPGSQSATDYCLDWLMKAPDFPPEGLQFQCPAPGEYQFLVPAERAEIWLTATLPAPGILLLLRGTHDSPVHRA